MEQHFNRPGKESICPTRERLAVPFAQWRKNVNNLYGTSVLWYGHTMGRLRSGRQQFGTLDVQNQKDEMLQNSTGWPRRLQKEIKFTKVKEIIYNKCFAGCLFSHRYKTSLLWSHLYGWYASTDFAELIWNEDNEAFMHCCSCVKDEAMLHGQTPQFSPERRPAETQVAFIASHYNKISSYTMDLDPNTM